MGYKVLKAFKCRHQNLKVFNEKDDYESVDKKHTEKLLSLGFIEEVKTEKAAPKKSVKKTADAE